MPLRHYAPRLTPRSRDLRRAMSPAERHLWYDFLSPHPVRFARQRPIGDYIVDFYCASARLVVELDGTSHDTAESQAYDARRTAYLQSQGLRVVRFLNADVMQSFPAVCAQIEKLLPTDQNPPAPE